MVVTGWEVLLLSLRLLLVQQRVLLSSSHGKESLLLEDRDGSKTRIILPFTFVLISSWTEGGTMKVAWKM